MGHVLTKCAHALLARQVMMMQGLLFSMEVSACTMFSRASPEDQSS